MRVKVYLRKNGKPMLYLNGSNGVSVGLSERVYTSKLTKGQKNTLNEFKEAIKNAHSVKVALDASKHKEDFIDLDFDYTLFLTDVATVCDFKTDSDGAFLYNKRTQELYDIEDIL